MQHYEIWQDSSPHVERFLRLGDVRLHYLDWGGDGPPLVFLAGLGDTAYIFDGIAPALTRHYRVLALTRRGHGASEAPEGGFAPQDLAADVLGFLNSLDLRAVTLVGHSVAGNEMTVAATMNSGLFRRLVYLDAAYDRSGTLERMARDPASALAPLERPPTLDACRVHGEEFFGFWSDALEANLRARLGLGVDGNSVPPATRVMKSIVEESSLFEPSYEELDVPAVALYAMYGDEHWSPRANRLLDPTVLQKFMREVMQPWQRQSIELFRSRAPSAEVIELTGVGHYFFLDGGDRLIPLLLEQ